jgi:predicted ATPase
MVDTVVDALRDRALLVVLDNCEHVIDAVAKLADAILRSCPQVELLATSREPLGISGEHVYRVPSLTLPDVDASGADVAASEAVRLFVERAAQHKPGFELSEDDAPTVVQICRRLDGIPLAIELAAARLRSMSIAELDSRLDQRFRLLTGGSRTALPRQQTLQALVDWSWDLLTPTERTILVRLAVFAGGWDLAAAEAVTAGGDVDEWDVLDLLTALVDKSLVATEDRDGTTRYRLLETVRDYAAAKFAERGAKEATEVRLRHRDHYVAWAEAAQPQLLSWEQAVWLDRVEVEQDNLRAALAQCLADANPEPGLRLVVALHRFWIVSKRGMEGSEAGRAVLARPGVERSPIWRGRALASTADLLGQISDYEHAIELAEAAITIGKTVDDMSIVLEAMHASSCAACRVGDRDDARAAGKVAVELARGTGDARLLADALASLDRVEAISGNTSDTAFSLEVLELCRQLGDHFRTSIVCNNLGSMSINRGDFGAARAYLEESLALSEKLGSAPLDQTFNLGLADLLDGNVGSSRARFTRCLVIARRVGDASMIGYSMLGAALATSGAPSAELLGATDALFESLDEQLEPMEQRLHHAAIARIRDELGNDAFTAAYGVGLRLSRDEAIARVVAGS